MGDGVASEDSVPVDVFSVSRLNRTVRELIEGSLPSVWVQGEVSNLATPASGHLYFSLKDRNAQVRCAFFRGRHSGNARPQDGMAVLVRAQVSLYEGRGDYQLIVQSLELAGEGSLLRAFEALKRSLASEGLFAAARKRPLPAFPRRIGLISSPTGAAVRDALSVLRRRWPLAELLIYPVPVQGREAAPALVEMINLAALRQECELLLLLRGGGTLEDLWAFNEESVARAISACEIPLVSGVGHEVDLTIADLVADRRGATPSAAAEIASPDVALVRRTLAVHRRRIQESAQGVLQSGRHHVRALRRCLPRPDAMVRGLQQRLDECALRQSHALQRLLHQLRWRTFSARRALQAHSPRHRLRMRRERLYHLQRSLPVHVARFIQARRQHIESVTRTLQAFSPQATLKRGYAIVRCADSGAIVRRADQLRPQQRISATLAQGVIHAQVCETEAEEEPG